MTMTTVLIGLGATIATAAPSRYEAETAPVVCTGTIDANHAGYSGTGFCNGDNAVGAAVRLTVTTSAAGTATLDVRFANGSTTARPAAVLVNGTSTQTVPFAPTGAWTTWVTTTVTVPVNPGTTTIGFSPTTAGGLPNLDYFDLTGSGPSPSPSPCAPPSSSSPPPQGQVTVWLAGDSTVADPSGGTVCPAGWGNQFAQYFTSDVTVRNSAVGGRSIQTWLYDPNVTSTKNPAGECVVSPETYSSRWQAMLDPTTGMKRGDYLLIQFGINDGTSACPRHVGSARYQRAARDDGHRRQGARRPPRLPDPAGRDHLLREHGGRQPRLRHRDELGRQRERRPRHRPAPAQLHALQQPAFLPFNGDYGSGPVGAFFCADHTHFEPSGARQIAGVVTRALRDQQIPLATYLR